MKKTTLARVITDYLLIKQVLQMIQNGTWRKVPEIGNLPVTYIEEMQKTVEECKDIGFEKMARVHGVN